MGVDATIFFDPGVPMTDREVEIANWRLIEATGDRGYSTPPRLIDRVEEENGYRHDYETGAAFQIRTGDRYYGPGYERGPWPQIASVLMWLLLNYPNGKVWYGGDSGDTLPQATIETIAETWKHWAEHGGVPYRSGWNTENKSAPPCCGMPIFINHWQGAKHGGYCPVCEKSYWVNGTKLEEIKKND